MSDTPTDALIEKLPPELQTNARAPIHDVLSLLHDSNVAHGVREEQAITLIETLKPEEQAAVLATPGIVWNLAFMGGNGERTVAIIEKLKPEEQTAVLAAPEAVYWLARSGQGERTNALIGKLNPEQVRAWALIDRLRAGMTENGQEALFAALIEKLPPELRVIPWRTRTDRKSQSSDLEH